MGRFGCGVLSRVHTEHGAQSHRFPLKSGALRGNAAAAAAVPKNSTDIQGAMAPGRYRRRRILLLAASSSIASDRERRSAAPTRMFAGSDVMNRYCLVHSRLLQERPGVRVMRRTRARQWRSGRVPGSGLTSWIPTERALPVHRKPPRQRLGSGAQHVLECLRHRVAADDGQACAEGDRRAGLDHEHEAAVPTTKRVRIAHHRNLFHGPPQDERRGGANPPAQLTSRCSEAVPALQIRLSKW